MLGTCWLFLLQTFGGQACELLSTCSQQLAGIWQTLVTRWLNVGLYYQIWQMLTLKRFSKIVKFVSQIVS